MSKSEPLTEGTVILADEQFAGRGQANNSWHSQTGKNLTFSILLKPGFLPVHKQFELNKAVSLAIADVLRALLGDDLKIKWPNDIFFGSKKLGGILIENIIQGNRWKNAIIGIGLNVNQTKFPTGLEFATSVKNILRTDCNLEELLADLCKAVEVRYLQAKAGKFDRLHQDYLNALFRFDEYSSFRINGELQRGKICGVSPDGLLQLKLEGKAREFGFKETEFIID